MKTIPQKCAEVNIASSFCNCIEGEEVVDAAAKGFCGRAKRGSDRNTAEDELAELKKALMDLESGTERAA